MISFIRQSKVAMWILTVLRVYLGVLWVIASSDKVFKSDFNAIGMIKGAIALPLANKPGNPGNYVYGWFTDFLKATTQGGTNAGPFNFLVPYGELLVGIGLIVGCFTLAANFFGLMMGFTYLLCGSLSNIPTLIILGFIIMMGGFNASKIGLDYWVTPFLRQHFKFLNNDISTRLDA